MDNGNSLYTDINRTGQVDPYWTVEIVATYVVIIHNFISFKIIHKLKKWNNRGGNQKVPR